MFTVLGNRLVAQGSSSSEVPEDRVDGGRPMRKDLDDTTPAFHPQHVGQAATMLSDEYIGVHKGVDLLMGCHAGGVHNVNVTHVLQGLGDLI